MRKAFINARIFDGDRWLEKDRAVVVRNGKVESILSLAELPADIDREDLHDNLLAPSLIDLQIYGAQGKLFPFDPSAESLQAIHEYCLSGGAAYFQATIPTHSTERMLASIEAVKAYWQQGGKGLIGLHLEGPYLNPEKKGAHLRQFIKQPTREEISMLLEKGKGIISMMTLAPEMCDPALVDLLQENGVVVSAGHSNASYEEAMRSFRKGIKVCTHLFNAMSPFLHREQGLVGAIYDSDAACSIVADGIHVGFPAIRISKRLMQERLFLITDAVTENAEGEYVYVKEKDRYVTANGVLAGSCLTMIKAVQHCVEKVGITWEESWRMGSLYPARVMGKERELGKIAPGYRADFAVLSEEWDLIKMIGSI